MTIMLVVLSLFVLSLVLWIVLPEGRAQLIASQFAKGFMLSIYFMYVFWAFVLYIPMMIIEAVECYNPNDEDYDPAVDGFGHIRYCLIERLEGADKVVEWAFRNI